MTIQYLNCLTFGARVARERQVGALCLLVESNDGLVLIDTGLGRREYVAAPRAMRLFRLIVAMPLIPEEAAVCQVARLGYRPEDVRHIVLTHMHFDHAGGVPDFPWAKIHVHRREYETIQSGKIRRLLDLGYNRRILDHGIDFVLYEETGDKWYDFDAIRLPFEPEFWMLPLFGHTLGHCGVAIKDDDGWLLQVGDAAFFTEDIPKLMSRFALGPHGPRLCAFEKAHPEVRMVTGHVLLDFFRTQS